MYSMLISETLDLQYPTLKSECFSIQPEVNIKLTCALEDLAKCMRRIDGAKLQ